MSYEKRFIVAVVVLLSKIWVMKILAAGAGFLKDGPSLTASKGAWAPSEPLPPPPLPPPSPRLPDNGLPPAVAVPAVLPFVAPGRHRRLGATRPSFSVSVGCRLSGALVRPGGSSVASEGHLALSTVSESISSTLLEKQLKFPRYNMKCRGKPDTT